MIFGFFSFSPSELFLVLLIILVIFGPRKLPEIGKALGESISGFKAARKEGEKDKTIDQPKNEEGQR